MSALLEPVSSQRCFGGWQRRFRHASASTRCDSQPAASVDSRLPATMPGAMRRTIDQSTDPSR